MWQLVTGAACARLDTVDAEEHMAPGATAHAAQLWPAAFEQYLCAYHRIGR